MQVSGIEFFMRMVMVFATVLLSQILHTICLSRVVEDKLLSNPETKVSGSSEQFRTSPAKAKMTDRLAHC